ncbi:uncharacterized protein LOC127741687 [Arachis duranensis]|uniref:Uncharacterized protein LOC127741687 n=1 Tax=Arachis duranensis TaxID=130453 RepID=A0A9C6WD31_ARADU|nr:uncharacterized protein LOC127741687 [Arachis duranensis]
MSSDGGWFPIYVVRRGCVPSMYRSWQECDQQVKSYQNSEHRGFCDLSEALAWLRSTIAPPARQPTRPVQPVRRKSSRLLEGAFCSIPSSQQVSSRAMVAGSRHCGGGDNSGQQGGYAMRDYNYRVLGRVTEQLNQVNTEEVDRLNERICSLELENKDLRGQVELFGEMLDK